MLEINIPGNLVIFIWIVFAMLALVGTVIGVRWAKREGQFDEAIKYQIFTEEDDKIFQARPATGPSRGERG